MVAHLHNCQIEISGLILWVVKPSKHEQEQALLEFLLWLLSGSVKNNNHYCTPFWGSERDQWTVSWSRVMLTLQQTMRCSIVGSVDKPVQTRRGSNWFQRQIVFTNIAMWRWGPASFVTLTSHLQSPPPARHSVRNVTTPWRAWAPNLRHVRHVKEGKTGEKL